MHSSLRGVGMFYRSGMRVQKKAGWVRENTGREEKANSRQQAFSYVIYHAFATAGGGFPPPPPPHNAKRPGPESNASTIQRVSSAMLWREVVLLLGMARGTWGSDPS